MPEKSETTNTTPSWDETRALIMHLFDGRSDDVKVEAAIKSFDALREHMKKLVKDMLHV